MAKDDTKGAFDDSETPEKLAQTDEQYKDATTEDPEPEGDAPALDISVAAQFAAAEEAVKQAGEQG